MNFLKALASITKRFKRLFIVVGVVVALVLVSILLYAAQEAYYLENPSAEKNARYPAATPRWLLILWGTALLQIILGTRIREAVEIMGKAFPLSSRNELLNNVGTVQHVHWVLGIVMFFITARTSARLLTASENPSPLARTAAWTMTGLIAAQIFIGIILVSAGLPAPVQLLHLWTASFYIGAVLILYLAVKKAAVHVPETAPEQII